MNLRNAKNLRDARIRNREFVEEIVVLEGRPSPVT
jgi:hypothetical protein